MNWEYKAVFFQTDVVSPQKIEEDEYEEALYSGIEMLNEVGSHGWELVNFMSHKMSSGIIKYHAVLKRPKA